MPDERQPLFCYCLGVGEREIAIRVTQDGVINWDDYQQRRTSRGARAQRGEGIVLAIEPDTFTVSFELGPELLARFRTAAVMLEAGTWTTEDERQLDEVLIPLFWERVNARLMHPLPNPETSSSPAKKPSRPHSSS